MPKREASRNRQSRQRSASERSAKRRQVCYTALMDDAPAPPPEQIFAVGDTVVVRAIVRQVARDECYLQIEGGNPRWQFWIPAKAIEGKPIRTAPPLF